MNKLVMYGLSMIAVLGIIGSISAFAEKSTGEAKTPTTAPSQQPDNDNDEYGDFGGFTDMGMLAVVLGAAGASTAAAAFIINRKRKSKSVTA